MKKYFLFILLLISSITHAFAQGFVIHLKDGTSVIYPSSEVINITLIPSDEGLIIGNWYLGIWKSGSRALHFDGTECMSFTGNHLEWTGRQDGSGTYTLVYSNDNTSYTATNVDNPSDVAVWTILKYTSNLLVLRNGGADRYFYKTPEEARNAVLPPDHAESFNIETILSYSIGKTSSSITPMGKHFENRHQTTDEDRAWLTNPDNEPNTVATLTQWIAKPVNLYPYDSPVAADVNQHAIGDCSACAVFASMAYLYPDFIKHIIKDNGNNTYTVSMYDPQGNTVDVCVSNKILCDKSGQIGQVTGKNNVITWATIMEKALIKWESRYNVDAIEGIGSEFVAPLFTGCGDSFAYPANSLYTSELKTVIDWALQLGKISIGGFNVGGLKCGVLETVTAHAFTFMLSDDENAIFAMRNPWGIESVDGVLQIPDNRTIVQTIDARIIEPGAAAPYLREDLKAYNPPAFTRMPTDIGVASRLINRIVDDKEMNELW